MISKRKLHTGKYWRLWLFVIPSLIGMSVFYFAPSLISVYHSFTNVAGDFMWFENFITTARCFAFQTAVSNTVAFMAIVVPLNIFLSFFFASLLQDLVEKKFFAVLFMLPLLIPSGAVVFFWQVIFADNGLVNRLMFLNGAVPVMWFSSNWIFPIIIIVFLFRNIGFNMILFMSGYQLIPKEYYELAKTEGASLFQTFRIITFVYMLPTTFLVFVMTLVNSFRIFRELYLLFGEYPFGRAYLLQHFMNNQFALANLQRLSTSATMLSLVITILVVGLFWGQRKISDSFD